MVGAEGRLWALIRALELSEGKKVHIYTDSRYAFATVHIHGAIYQERGLLTAEGKDIKNRAEVLRLLEAVWAPAKVVVIHCPGHQREGTEIARGNWRADRAAKEAAQGASAPAAAPALEGAVLDLSPTQSDYTSEAQKWAIQTGCTQTTTGIWEPPDGQLYVPQTQVSNLVRQRHTLTHLGKTSLEALLKKYHYFPNLASIGATTVARRTACAWNNAAPRPQRTVGIQHGTAAL